MNFDYWKGSLEEVFGDNGLELTDELVKDIMFIGEMESEATGTIHIPNPLKSEIDRLEKRIVRIKEEHNHQLLGIRKGVAQRRYVDVQNVHIDEHGYVTYDK